MEALEQLTTLLMQQHALQPVSGGGSEGAAAAAPTTQDMQGGKGHLGSGNEHAEQGDAQDSKQGADQPLKAEAPAQQQQSSDATADAVAPANASLSVALASLLQHHQTQTQQKQQPPQQAPKLSQQQQEATARPPSQHEAVPDMQRDESDDVGPAATAAAVIAAAESANDDTGRSLQLELAKAIAQVVISHLQQHPTCIPLKQMGAAISDVLVKCVTPSGLASGQLALSAFQPPKQQSQSAPHMLLAALFQPSLGATPGSGAPSSADALLLQHLADAAAAAPGTAGTGSGMWELPPGAARGGGSDGADALLAAALGAGQPPPIWSQDQHLFRPQALRAPGAQADQGGNANNWNQLMQAVPQSQQVGALRLCLFHCFFGFL